MKERIVKTIVKKSGCTVKDAKELYEEICAEVRNLISELDVGENVPLFGVFSVFNRARKARGFINIATRQKETIPAKNSFYAKVNIRKK